MQRRKYIALGGALFGAGIAGCTDGSEDIDDPQNTEADSSSGNGGSSSSDPDTPEETEPEPETETEEPTRTEPEGEPDIQFGDRELVKDDSGYTLEAWAEVIVENTGDAASGQVNVKAEWYDSDGNFVGDDTTRLPSLDAGETWIAQVSAISADAEDVEDFEVNGEFETGQPAAPQGMQVTESELVIEDFSAQITGVAENNRDEVIDYVEAHGKIYDDQDRVIGGGWTNETEIPEGRNWSFEILLTGRAAARAEDAADHVAFLDADIF